MRWCSRWAGPAGVCWACFGACGNDAGGPPAESSAELQPARTGARTANANAAGLNEKCTGRANCGLIPATRSAAGGGSAGFFSAFTMLPSAFGDLDLLRPDCLDPRPTAFLDPSAHPHVHVCKPSRVPSGSDETALITFQDRDRERLRPTPSEIHVYRACALADR